MPDRPAWGPARAVREYAWLRDLAGGDGDPAARYEVLCLAEQFVADLALLARSTAARLAPMLADLRPLLVESAGRIATGRDAVAAPGLPPVRWLMDVLETTWAPLDPRWRREFAASPGFYPRWADCLSAYPVDFRRYAAAVEALAPSRVSGRCLVLGIRTTGSYLAPLWTHAVRSAGSDADYLTVRPRRRLDGTIELPDLPGDQVAEAREVLIVDDGVFTGRTLEHVENAVAAAAQPETRIQSSVYFGHSVAARRRSSASTVPVSGCRRRLPKLDDSDLREFFANAVRQLGLGALVLDAPVRPCPPGYWHRYLGMRVDVPQHVIDGLDHRVRKRRYRFSITGTDGARVNVVAKYLGWGPLVEHEIRTLRELWYPDTVLGAASGFLLCRWLPGRVVGFGGGRTWPVSDVDRLGANAALLYLHHLLRDADPGEWRDRVDATVRRWERLSPVAATSLRQLAASPRPFPVVTLPRNQGHWHYVRLDDGDFRRFHQDRGRWDQRADPAWDLASTVLELGLDSTQTARLLAAYRDRSGDVGVAGRLPLAAAEYALAAMDELRQHHKLVAGVPARFRRPGPDVVLPYARRLGGILSAAATLLRVPAAEELHLPADVARHLGGE